jgi:mono/diheme cytochrome c family protein
MIRPPSSPLPQRQPWFVAPSVRLAYALLMGMGATPGHGETVSFQKTIAPIFRNNCAECHGLDAPTLSEYQQAKEKYKKEKLGPKMNTLAEIKTFVTGSEAGVLMQRIDDGSRLPDKKPGNMYRRLGETDSERAANLKLIQAWISGGLAP